MELAPKTKCHRGTFDPKTKPPFIQKLVWDDLKQYIGNLKQFQGGIPSVGLRKSFRIKGKLTITERSDVKCDSRLLPLF